MIERKQAIRDFIINRLQEHARRKRISMENLSESESFFESNILNSLEFLELVAAVESAFDLELDFSEMDPAEFTCIKGLVELCSVSQTGEGFVGKGR